ncbi:IclR family transcriptional regulator [Modestobacter sp. SYSU DS0511]
MSHSPDGRTDAAPTIERAGVGAIAGRRDSPTQRALRVLACFSPARRELSLTEIAAETDLPMSTAHRIVGELASWGALVRSGRSGYHVGIRLCEIAASSPHGTGLREISWPYLEDVYEATRENVLLAVRDGVDMVYVARLSGRDSVPVLREVGRRRSLTTTGTGLALLAHSPTDVQDEVLSRPLRRYTDRTVTDPDELRVLLAEVRRTGFAATEGTLRPGTMGCGVPVRGANDEVVASLGAVAHAATMQPRLLVPVLMGAARGLSRELGAPSAQRFQRGTRRTCPA